MAEFYEKWGLVPFFGMLLLAQSFYALLLLWVLVTLPRSAAVGLVAGLVAVTMLRAIAGVRSGGWDVIAYPAVLLGLFAIGIALDRFLDVGYVPLWLLGISALAAAGTLWLGTFISRELRS